MAVEAERLVINLEARLNKFDRDMRKAAGISDQQFGRVRRQADITDRRLASVGSTLKSSALFTSLSARLAPLALVGAAGLLGKNFVEKTIAQQEAVAKLEAVIKSTGGVAGVTSSAAQDMAAALQKVTTFGDESIIPAQALLLTFTKIGKDVFPQATETVLDMSEALGQDLKSSAIQLGKALNDPVQGITALRRVGVSFSDSQRSVITNLAQTGHVAEAQTLILQELQREFGGTAQAARQTLGGALKALGNAIGDTFELNGPPVEGLREKIEDLIKTVSDPKFTHAMSEIGSALFQAMQNIASATVTIVGAVEEAQSALAKLDQKLSSIGNADIFKKINLFMARNGLMSSGGLTITDPDLAAAMGQGLTPDGRIDGAFGTTAQKGGLDAASQKLADALRMKFEPKHGYGGRGAEDDDPIAEAGAKSPISTARQFVGLNENRDSALLTNLFKQAGQNVDPRMTAWCAAFVNAVLATNGIKGTGSLSARSFLNYGQATDDPRQGDIAVLKRGKNAAQGHVGFFDGFDENNNPILVSGNSSGGDVTRKAYNKADVLGYRSVPGASRGNLGDLAEATSRARASANDRSFQALDMEVEAQTKLRDAIRQTLGSQADETKQMQMETSLQSSLTGEREKALTVARLENELKRAGIPLTDDLRAKIEQLAEAQAAAATAQEQAAVQQDALREQNEITIAQMDDFRDSSRDVLGGFISDMQEGKTATEALGNALDNIADKLLNRGLDSITDQLFGSRGSANPGPLGGVIAGLFLGGGGASAVSPGVGGLFADGGLVRGPGSGTSDSIAARLSNGEFVATASATRKHRALLEAINSDRLPAFARGGYVGPMGGASRMGLAGGAAPQITVQTIDQRQSGAPVETKTETDAQGNTRITSLIRDQARAEVTRKGTPTNKFLRAGGFQPPVVNRG